MHLKNMLLICRHTSAKITNDMNSYLLFKLLHIIAVIVFLGNVYTGLFWMKQANKTSDPGIIAFTMGNIIKSDRWFTVPSVIIITAGGISAALYAQTPILRTGWIFWPIILFTFSGLVFSAKLVPLQKRIFKIASMMGASKDKTAEYNSMLSAWEHWGHIAILAPLAALVMMVLKIPVQRGF